ncbi:hypothetical protein ACFLZV_00110 [Candidatus Margulisiibacteriota bacterium]
MSRLYLDYSYEKRLYKTIVNRVLNNQMSNENKILKLLELTHQLLGPPRKGLLIPETIGLKEKLLFSADEALIGGYACGMHAQVLGMLLTTAGFDFRFFSMEKEGRLHHVGQVLYAGKYIAIDPLFNQTFIKVNGDYATVKEINKNWDYFKNQVGNKLFFKRHKDYDTVFYQKHYNFNPPKERISLFRIITNALLGKNKAEKLAVKRKLSRYFYWQINLTCYYAFMVFCLMINFVLYYLLIKRMRHKPHTTN